MLPELEKVNSDVSGTLARMADIVAVDADWLEHVAQNVWDRVAKVPDEASREAVSIDRKAISYVDDAIVARIGPMTALARSTIRVSPDRYALSSVSSNVSRYR